MGNSFGSTAAITPAESVSGMLQVITSLRASDSGKFFDFKGNELPW
jgi:hypothetical protein